MRAGDLFGLFLAGLGALDFGQAHALRRVLKGEQTEDGRAHGYDRGDDEAHAPGAIVTGVTHNAGGLIRHSQLIPALDAHGEVACDALHYLRVAAHIRAQAGHNHTADYHCEETSYRVRSVPDTHLGAQLVRRDPLREHTRARRITAALEILVEHYRDAHHEDEHIDKLRAFVYTGDGITQVHAEAEAEVGGGAEEEADGHEHFRADLLHYETVDEAAEAVDQRAYGDDDTETGVADAVFGREARHSDGKVLAYEIEDGVNHHRHDDSPPLPELEGFIGLH